MSWESQLLELAHVDKEQSSKAVATPMHDVSVLNNAYAHCEAVIAHHSRSFLMASSFLPEAERKAARALYAFCRTTDDIVDHPNGDAYRELQQWKKESLAAEITSENPIAIAWHDTRTRYGIPIRYAEQLIDGVSQDLITTRYCTFSDLAHYCYGVASTVGLMTMNIVGYASKEAIPYAVKLGVALQLTNILRDIKEDFLRGRIYLPMEELNAYDLSQDDIEAGAVTRRWRAFMQFQIARVRQLYKEAQPGIAMLNHKGRLAIAASAELYQAILDDIEAHNYDVFSRRAHIKRWGKLKRLPGIWWRVHKWRYHRS